MHIGLEFSWKGLLEVIKSIPLLKAGPTFKLQCAVQLNSEYFQGWISTLYGQPIPVLKYLTEEFFFCVHSEFSLLPTDCCVLSFPCAAPQRVWLHPFCKPC